MRCSEPWWRLSEADPPGIVQRPPLELRHRRSHRSTAVVVVDMGGDPPVVSHRRRPLSGLCAGSEVLRARRPILIPAWRAVSTVRSVKAMDEITAGDVCTACGATVRATEVSERDAQGGVSMARVWSCGCDGVEGPQVADD